MGLEKFVLVPEIEELDLSLIVFKLMDKEDGANWSNEKCKEIEREYKKFLTLKKNYPEKEIVPTKDVDTFWHYHILDTRKYATDCENVFGFFLHHFPYFGMFDEDDYQNLCRAFDETNALYEKHFGEIVVGEAVRCRTGCKPVKCK